MKTFFVYILKCADDSYYTGITNDLERRIIEHQHGLNITCYTFKRRPLEIVYQLLFKDVKLAIAFEKQIKGWSRKKKQALIDGDLDLLRELAACKNETHSSNKKK